MDYAMTRGQKFRHFKGNIYTGIAIASNTETGEGLVIYSGSDNRIWARPVDMFFGYTNDGVKRFEEIEE